MAIEPLDTAPAAEDFKPLSEHEEQTPVSFFGGPAVLYCRLHNATVLIPREQLNATEALSLLVGDAEQDGEQGEDVKISGVDVWVSSRNLMLFSTSQAKGISISYPSIALHAMGTHESPHLPSGAASVVFLQINLHDPETTNEDDDVRTLDLTVHATEIVPAAPRATADATSGQVQDAPQSTAVQALFEALSACADLHPDPNEDEEGVDAAFADPAPGAGGWITAENMHEFVDAEGNFVPPPSTSTAPLGPGAGTVRAREDGDGADAAAAADVEGQQNGVNGVDGEETKWQRTS